MILNVKKNSTNARLPVRATEGSAGLDLFACIDGPVTILAGDSVLIPTGISIELPENSVGLVFGRSGHGIKHGIVLSNSVGVIDSDYRGEVKVGLRNLSGQSYTVNPDERIAQLVVTPIMKPEPVEVSELDQTGRGAGGFGSTGRV